MGVYGGLRVHSVTILRRHYFGVFPRTKKRNPINKGFQLLGYLKMLQFPYSVAKAGLDPAQIKNFEVRYDEIIEKGLTENPLPKLQN